MLSCICVYLYIYVCLHLLDMRMRIKKYYRRDRDKTFTTKGFLNHRESPRTSPWSSFRNIVGPSRSTWTRPWTCRRPWPGACNGYHHRSLRALCIPSSKMMNGVWAEITGKLGVWASGWLHPLDIRANIIHDTRMLVVGWLSGRSVMTWAFWEGEGLLGLKVLGIQSPWNHQVGFQFCPGKIMLPYSNPLP